MRIHIKLTLLLPVLLSANTIFAQQKTDSLKKTTAAKEDYKDDWADLRHYEAENKTLPAPAPNEKRVVFLGSSIFEFWKTRMPEYFTDHQQYLDRGIAGQISPQLLLRFQQDVINLQPKAVIMLVGSNDIAGTTGHVTNERIMDNIKMMVELAQLHHIKPILCAYLPVNDYPWRKGLEPAPKIIALNNLIKAYAEQQKLTLIDYFTPLVDPATNGQKPDQTIDGVHPNHAGYVIMAKVTDEAIAKTLK